MPPTFLLVMAMLTRCFVRQRFTIISIPAPCGSAFTLLVDAIVMGAGLTEMSAHYPLAVVFLGLSILTEIPVWLATA